MSIEPFIAAAEEARLSGRKEDEYRYALAAAQGVPGNPEGWYRLGIVLHELKRPGAAAAAFARAAELGPGDYRAVTNVGWNLYHAGRAEEALWWLDRAVEMAPHEGLPLSNRSVVKSVLGDDEGSLRDADAAVAMNPADPVFVLARSFALFFNNRWSEAWPAYEARIPLKLQEFANRPYVRWMGERVDRLFVEAEQGLGDVIQMLRYVPDCCERVGKVILFVQKELYRLCDDAFRDLNVDVFPLPQPLPVCDAWVPVMNLPMVLKRPNPEPVGAYL